MSSHRSALPQLGGPVFLTDGGMETTLIYRQGLELPHFAAFTLLADEHGREALRAYYADYVSLAAETGHGLVLDAATWRASPAWGERLGYSARRLADANADAVRLLAEVREARPAGSPPLVVNGVAGPRGDGYAVDEAMSAAEAERYHGPQVAALAAAGADLVTATTMTHAEEATGVARAAAARDVPVAISFTVETDGRLPTGQPLAEAVEQVDDGSAGAPAYFMVNCAHPTHFEHVFGSGHPALARIRGVRANASTKSHAELDEADELDDGDPDALAVDMSVLRRRHAPLDILGGCCGTDHRHIAAIAAATSSG